MVNYNIYSWYALAAVAMLAPFPGTSPSRSMLVTAIDTSNCAPLADLGTDNLDRYKYAVDMKIIDTGDDNDSCGYEVKIQYTHDSNLPVPTNPGMECNPESPIPPVMATDGLPYFAFRWAYESVPEVIKAATGIDHISIDFNPCGHPPYNVFTAPHYDLHIYRESPDYRSCMTCTTFPGQPICDPGNQTTPSGHGTLFVLPCCRI